MLKLLPHDASKSQSEGHSKVWLHRQVVCHHLVPYSRSHTEVLPDYLQLVQAMAPRSFAGQYLQRCASMDRFPQALDLVASSVWAI